MFITNNDIILNSIITSPIVVDMQDKMSSGKVEYNVDNLIEYHLRTLDSRIGEITNFGTSLLNQKDSKSREIDDLVALLRIYQGKEIDYIKTGVRWNVTNDIRQKAGNLPHFLIYKYDKLKKRHEKFNKDMKERTQENSTISISPKELELLKEKDSKKYYFDYRSKKLKEDGKINNMTTNEIEEVIYGDFYKLLKNPTSNYPSPLNTLSHHLDRWEKYDIMWNKNKSEDTRRLLKNNKVTYDKNTYKKVEKLFHHFINEFKEIDNNDAECFDEFFDKYRNTIKNKYSTNKKEVVNAVVDIVYKSKNSKGWSFAWSLFEKEILKNLMENSKGDSGVVLEKVDEGADNSVEYLGEYYILKETHNGKEIQ